MEVMQERKELNIITRDVGESLVIISGDKVSQKRLDAFIGRHSLRKLAMEENLFHLVRNRELRDMLKGKVIITSTLYISERQNIYSIGESGNLIEWSPGNPEKALYYGYHGDGLITIYVNKDRNMNHEFDRRYEVISSAYPRFECEIDKHINYQSVVVAKRLGDNADSHSMLRQQK